MDINLPSLRSLEAFICAAEALSFTEAANRLNITPSAVGHRITTLEQEVGVALFFRDGKKISLTSHGREYYYQISPALESMKKSTHNIGKMTKENSISISSFQLFSGSWLSEKIGDFIKIFPDANIEFRSLRLRRVTDADITIKIIREGEERAGFDKLMDWNILPACHRNLIREYNIKDPADLARAHIIETVSAPDVWPLWLDHVGLQDLPFPKTLLVDSAQLQVDLIKRGAGTGMVADFLIQSLKDYDVVAPFRMFHKYSGGIYINKTSRHEREIVTVFRNWMQGQIAIL